MSPLVEKAIDATIASLRLTRFATDPILPLELSRLCSIVESAKKRHGKIIEIAILAGLQTESRFIAWEPKRFLIPGSADRMTSLVEEDGLRIERGAVRYTGVGRKVQIDVVVWDRETRILRAYEIKRGHGQHDAGKIRSMLRDLRGIQAALRSFGEHNGYSVAEAEARIIFWYGNRSIPAPWSLTGGEVDGHFGFPLSAFVEEATWQFSARLHALLAGDTDPYAAQQTLAFGGEVNA